MKSTARLFRIRVRAQPDTISAQLAVSADFLQQIDAVAAENERGRESGENRRNVAVFAGDHEDFVEHLVKHRDADGQCDGGKNAGPFVLRGQREREECAEEGKAVKLVRRSAKSPERKPQNFLFFYEEAQLDAASTEHSSLTRSRPFSSAER